jgi:hypothetical protein
MARSPNPARPGRTSIAIPIAFSDVAAASLRGATPIERRAPFRTALTISSSVGESSPAPLWRYLIAARRLPNVDGFMPALTWSARKAATVAGIAGIGQRP